MATDRIILHSTIAAAFITALKAALASNANASTPPLTLVTAASKVRVQRLISEAVTSGARLIHGYMDEDDVVTTEGNGGVHVTPIILDGARENMSVWQDELFAPLAACMTVKDDEEAVKVANKGGYGLSAAVFTEDLRKGLRLAKQLESGYVSCCLQESKLTTD